MSTEQYLTVKCPIQSVVTDHKMLAAIEQRVRLVSKMMHRGSHVVLLTAVHCYHESKPFPEIKVGSHASNFIKHCFNPYPVRDKNGQWGTTLVPHEVMSAVHDDLEWPEPADRSVFTGYGRHNTLQSNQYATNLLNHITMNIWGFIQHTITSFCRLHQYPTSKKNPFVKEIMNAIKDPTHVCTENMVRNSFNELIPVNEQLRDDFIKYHREYLAEHSINLLGDEESGVTIEEQAQKIVLYFVHLLEYQNKFNGNEEVNAKLFYPVPVHGIKRHHMDIDGEIIYYLLKDCGVVLPSTSSVNGKCMNAPYFVRDGLQIEYFKKYFSIEQFKTRCKYFNYGNGISTDGVSLSVLMKKDDTVEAGVAQQRKKEFRHLSGNRAQEKKKYVSIDPGQVVLMSYAEYQQNGTMVGSGSILSQREYYHSCGITAANKKYLKWKIPLQGAHDAMSVSHYRVVNWNQLLDGIRVMLLHSNLLFEHMFHKCWAKTKFAIYRKKQKVIAKAVNGLQDPSQPDIIVLYGDGSFPSGGRGRNSVPVKGIKDAVMRQYEVVEVDEFRTSSVCPECGDQLFKVLEFFNGKYYEVRGLKWCGSNECKSHPIYTRDIGVGCANIFLRHMDRGHPIMDRDSDLPWEGRYETPRHVLLSTQNQLPPKCLRRKYKREY